MDLNEKNPRNPQVDEVEGLDWIWNEANIYLPGVKVLPVKKADSFFDPGKPNTKNANPYCWMSGMWSAMPVMKH